MSGADHQHDHDAHEELGSSARPGYYDMMETAIRELLVENQFAILAENACKIVMKQQFTID